MIDLNKRFWVFAFDEYESSGGMSDLFDTFEDLSEASDAAVRCTFDTCHIFDSAEGVIVETDYPSHCFKIPVSGTKD